MRLLILSEEIDHEQKFGKVRYAAPYDVHLDIGDLNSTNDFRFSVFDYDVAIIIIEKLQYHSMGYYQNLPKLLRDSRIALENGRSVICLPKSRNFRSEKLNEYGMPVYDWVRQLGIELQDNVGTDIKASGAGKAQVIQDYLRYAPQYHQIVVSPPIPLANRLTVVDDTDIVVGLEHQVGKGMLVILPPPIIDTNTYILVMFGLVDLARRYYGKMMRRIAVGDAPDWLGQFLVPRAKALEEQIHTLADEKAELDRAAYVLYGTGDELETSVSALLQRLGLTVDPQPPSANIDLKARHPMLGLGFAIEVTGTKGTIQKDTNKIAQAWQYLSERSGTPEENDRLIILANTQCHLNPNERRDDAFTPNVVNLLADKGVLLMTTFQLYVLWKSVYEGRLSADDVIRNLHGKSGLYRA